MNTGGIIAIVIGGVVLLGGIIYESINSDKMEQVQEGGKKTKRYKHKRKSTSKK